jgi:hypothetical protein
MDKQKGNYKYQSINGDYSQQGGLKLKKIKDVYDAENGYRFPKQMRFDIDGKRTFENVNQNPITNSIPTKTEEEEEASFYDNFKGKKDQMLTGAMTQSLPALATGIANNKDSNDWINTGLDVAAPVLNALGPLGTAAYGAGKIGVALAESIQGKNREQRLQETKEQRELANVREQQNAKFQR